MPVRIRTCTAPCTLVTLTTLALAAHAAPPAQETTSAPIWVPGAAAPRDARGNSAVANAPSRDARPPSQGEQGGLRGDPNWTPFGPSGADAQSIAASPTVADLVLAGISNAFGGGGLYRSTDNGASWSLANGTGNFGISDVEFASSGVAWAAAGTGGLYTSTDGGANWTQVALPVNPVIVEDVAVDPADPSVIWIGLGQFLGGTDPQVVLKSTDAGVTWNNASPPVTPGLGATVVAIDPANPQRVYAAFTGNFGAGNDLWYTTDGGTSWAEVSAGLPDNIINDVAFGPGGTVYVAGGQDFGSQFLGLFSTTDNGSNWTDMSADWPSRAANAVAADPADPQHILVGTTRAGLASSTNGGTTWAHSAGGTASYQVNDVRFVPGTPNIFLGLGSVAVFRSTNGGASFAPSASGMSSLELTSIAVNPANPSEIAASYVGANDGGIFVSTDAGQTWTLSSAPLPRWQKVYFGPDGTLYGTHDGPFGRADDGLWRRDTGGNWSNMGPGDPGFPWEMIGVDIAATPGPNPVILLGGYEWLGDFGGRIWSYNRAGTGQWELEFDSPFPFEQINSLLWVNGTTALAGVVLFGQEGGSGQVMRTTDSGDTWATVTDGPPAGWNVWDLGAGPGGAVYGTASANTGQFPAGIIKSTDAGATWTLQGTSNFTFRSFCVDPVLPGTIYGGDPFNSNGPDRSTDDGVTFSPFTTGFLPGRAIRDLTYGGVVSGERRLYAATSSGGFATTLAGGEPPCPADWDGNGSVNSTDISAYLVSWLNSLQLGDLNADFNNDNAVNSSDISAFLTAWLQAVQQGC